MNNLKIYTEINPHHAHPENDISWYAANTECELLDGNIKYQAYQIPSNDLVPLTARLKPLARQIQLHNLSPQYQQQYYDKGQKPNPNVKFYELTLQKLIQNSDLKEFDIAYNNPNRNAITRLYDDTEHRLLFDFDIDGFFEDFSKPKNIVDFKYIRFILVFN